MNAIQQLSEVHPNRLDDYFFQPQRFCCRQWKQISGPLDPHSSALKQAAYRIGAVILLYILFIRLTARKPSPSGLGGIAAPLNIV